jgi:predicted RND superfamily exporter protein
MFEREETDPVTLTAMDEIREIVQPYDSSISTTIGFNMADQLMKDMTLVGIVASIIILLVLIFTSNSYAEIPILLATFGVAALLNMGTNFLLGKISFISNSVGVILQLALAIDYAIILTHRFTEERELLPARDAAIAALTKAIPEITSSSLTTMAGLAALAFMKFGIGLDLAMVMIKAILLSMLAVFTLMPGLLVITSNLMDKTTHRSFIPSVSILGRFSIKTRYIIPPIFLVVLVVSFIFSSKAPFLFSMSEIRGHSISDSQRAEDRITAHFGKQNMLALIVPSGDYDSEKKLLSFLQIYPEVELAVGLSNIEAMSGYTLTDGLTPRQFAELADLDYEIAQILYSAYAVNEENYSKVISGIGQFKVPLIDMYQFLYQEVVLGYVSLDEEVVKELREYNDQMTTARMQMEGEHYSRMLLYLDLPDESPETFEFIGTIYREAYKYYPRDSVFLIGESTNALDLSTTFDNDNLIISILSVVFVIIILTFTFQSAGLPILLISVIQASIWINFSWPYVSNQGVYFLGYLLVSSIQMGANIDYAIIISSRFLDLRKDMPKKEAVIEALNQGFPTVITSGSILAVAGILIGFFSTDGATSVLGTYLGQGTIISVFLVIFVLPQLLYLGDGIIERTSFKLKKMEPFIREKGKVQVQGRLHGYVNGEIDAMVDGTITGDIKPIKNKEDAMDDEQSEEGGQD